MKRKLKENINYSTKKNLSIKQIMMILIRNNENSNHCWHLGVIFDVFRRTEVK